MSAVAVAQAPASSANLAAGFDLLGHSIHGPCDRARVTRTRTPGVRVLAMRGAQRGVDAVPLDNRNNTAGRALEALLACSGFDGGFEVEIDKGIPIGSGLGGSAASSVAALVAANALLDEPLPREAIYRCAVDGEAAASGCAHGDNVGASLYGGLVLATAGDAVPLAVPGWLHSAVVLPDRSLDTRHSRSVLDGRWPLPAFVTQSRHLALLLVGLSAGDTELISRGLHDVLVEPLRAPLVPGFAACADAARGAGALGASFSGGGPSVFAWFRSRSCAERGARAMRAAFAGSGIASRSWVSAVAGPAARLVHAQAGNGEATRCAS